MRPRLAVVANRRARGVTAERLDLLRRITRRDELVITDTPNQARQALAAMAARSPTAVIFAGGDGTVVHGLSVLDEVDPEGHLPIGALALGTGNAFATAIGASPDSEVGVVNDLERARVSAKSRRLPLIRAAGLRAPFCGVGIDAQLLEDHRALAGQLGERLGRVAHGKLGYAASLAARSLPRFALRRRLDVTVVNRGAALELDRQGAAVREHRNGGVLWRGALTLAACSTIRNFGLGLAMFPFARRRDDRFQVRAGDPGLAEVVRSAPAAFAGRYFSKRVHDFLCDRVEIRLEEPAAVQVGGELVGHHDRLTVELARPIRLAW